MVGGIGSILMLSSASAPSRVPQVVCSRQLVRQLERRVRGQYVPP
jgi:hypothetical protein